MSLRALLFLALSAAVSAQRPHWDRVQHFIFVLLPQASFDQYFGLYPDSEGLPADRIGKVESRTGAELPNYWAYADLYTLQDHFFSEPDAAGRLRAQTARVAAAGISWKEYTGDFEAFVEDSRNEALPAVSLLLPERIDGPEMAYLTRAVNAVAGSGLWRRSAVFVSWAETGGAFDHFPQPAGLGARVPSLVISPWSRLAYNDHRVYSHSSWLRTLDNRFGLEPSGPPAADLYDPFDFSQQPRDPVLLDPAGLRSYPVSKQSQIFPASGWLSNVHCSHGTWTVAPGSLVIGYGDGFVPEELAGTDPGLSRIVVRDAVGVTREATVQYTGKTQVNYVVPPDTAPGLAQVRIDTAWHRFDGFMIVEPTSPGLFTATQMGQGPAAGDAVGLEGIQSTYRCVDGICRNEPVGGDRVSLRGTGFRLAQHLRAFLDGREVEVLTAGPDLEVTGLDRVAIRLPPDMRGQVLVQIEADGVLSNAAQLLLAPGAAGSPAALE